MVARPYLCVRCAGLYNIYYVWDGSRPVVSFCKMCDKHDLTVRCKEVAAVEIVRGY